ncbi:VacJ family lipoprotein, partial [Pseudomonas aeruginosa]
MCRTAHWMFALLLSAAASAQADEAAAPAELPPRQLDGDGFCRPLDELKFNPGQDDREIERA